MSAHLDGLNLIELLDLLEPAPEPPPVSWMPQTAGWVFLGAAVAIGLWLGLRAVIRHRRANAYRRAGLAALDRAGTDPAAIAQVVRRTALAGFPRDRVAGLHGPDWLAFLDATLPGSGFSKGPGRLLATAPYQATPPDPDLPGLVRLWIRKHSRAAAPDGATRR